jgi:GAF domain-containing protein
VTIRVPEEVKDLPAGRADALGELQATLKRAGELLRSLENGAASAQRTAALPPELHARVAELEDDRNQLSQRLAEYEAQTGRLMNLYVATYQLHSTLDPREVQSTIAEIAINLLGAESFALLFWKGDGSECEIAMAEGLEGNPLYVNGRYAGGDPAVDATLTDGVLRIGPIDGSDVVAVVPLTVQGAVVGALVLHRLFEHKAMLRGDDRDLLDLLAAHAASALFAARVYSATDRKLKTLESLIQLVKRA